MPLSIYLRIAQTLFSVPVLHLLIKWVCLHGRRRRRRRRRPRISQALDETHFFRWGQVRSLDFTSSSSATLPLPSPSKPPKKNHLKSRDARRVNVLRVAQKARRPEEMIRLRCDRGRRWSCSRSAVSPRRHHNGQIPSWDSLTRTHSQENTSMASKIA